MMEKRRPSLEEDNSKEIFIFANLLICYIGRSRLKFLEWQRLGFRQTIL